MNKVRFERIRRGMTQLELGYAAKINTVDISRIENGWLKPYGPMSKRLAKVLGIPEEELIQEVG